VFGSASTASVPNTRSTFCVLSTSVMVAVATATAMFSPCATSVTTPAGVRSPAVADAAKIGMLVLASGAGQNLIDGLLALVGERSRERTAARFGAGGGAGVGHGVLPAEDANWTIAVHQI